MDKAIIDKVKADHPGVALRILRNDDFDEPVAFIVKTPTGAEWKRFRAMQEDPEQGVSPSIRALAQNHVVYPEQQELAALFERFPGLPEAIAKQLAKLAGAAIPLTVEKI